MNVNGIRIDNFTSRFTRGAHGLVPVRLTAMALFFGASLCMAQNNLVRLLPPDAPVLAGLRQVPQKEAKDMLWLATRNNEDDLSRLVALTDHDTERRIEQVMVADWALNGNRLGNHLLVAQGRFNLANVSAAAANRVVERLNYAGTTVLDIEAAGGSKPVSRWLAVPQRDVAVFGTPSAVQLALDRFRSGTRPDPLLLERLKNAHTRDAAWSSVVLDAHTLATHADLHTGDAFSACISRMREVGLGIQPGSTVTIDLQMKGRDASGGAEPGGSMQCVSEALFGRNTPQMRVAFSGDREPHVRVTMEHSQYDAWLDSFRTSRTHELLEAMISGSGPDAEPLADGAESLR
jgi:hypothetical protein